MNDLSCTYLAHHELKSLLKIVIVVIIIVVFIIIIIIVIIINDDIRALRHCWRTW